MTRHTRNRQKVEVNRRNPRKMLNVRMEMSSINVSMKSVYAEPKVWELDPNFRTVRLKTLKVTSRKGTHHPRNNKRLIDKHNRINNIEVYEQLQKGLDNLVFVVYNEDGSPHYLALTYKTQTRTVYFYTFKQPHISGNGNYFNRIVGVTKYGQRHFNDGRELPDNMKGIFDSEGYRLVVDHGDGTHSKTY